MAVRKYTEWQDHFCVLPRNVEGRWVWMKTVEYRYHDNGALGLLVGPTGEQYRLKPTKTPPQHGGVICYQGRKYAIKNVNRINT